MPAHPLTCPSDLGTPVYTLACPTGATWPPEHAHLKDCSPSVPPCGSPTMSALTSALFQLSSQVGTPACMHAMCQGMHLVA